MEDDLLQIFPPKQRMCTFLRVGEMHVHLKDSGLHVQETGDDGVPMIICMARYSCPVRESNCRAGGKRRSRQKGERARSCAVKLGNLVSSEDYLAGRRCICYGM
ncbi:hypothetical protein NQZ68_008332 [Dissostichus eleginoides]|nr:hypothetical protein NQZ68_008332 [Dissostichus eleginoides]